MRFMALIWNADDPAQSDAAQSIEHGLRADRRWTCPVEQSGFKIFYRDVQPTSAAALLLDAQVGAVLGTLFHGQHRKPCLTSSESTNIVESGGRWLIANCAGRYVLFVRDQLSQDVRILRDPTGGVRCLQTRYRGVHLFFSCMPDCLDAGLRDFPVNWDYLRAQLVTPAIQSRETALRAVTEVQQGECIRITRGILSSSWYWHPFRIAKSERIDTPENAATALREATLASVHAWAALHPRIVLRLSGGLDSSIVAACLSHAPTHPEVIAVNHYAPGADSDERPLARLVAQHTGFKLIEESIADRYELSAAELSEYPGFYLSTGHSIVRIARESGSSGLYDGTGGDEVYKRNYGEYAAADYRELYGLRPELVRVAWDVAQQQGTTIWSVLKLALLPKPAMNPAKAMHEHCVLLAPEVIDIAIRENAFLHPWFDTDEHVPPGVWWHSYALSFAAGIDNAQRADGDPERIAPLFSQRLFECALRIPSHLHAQGGWDRAMARRAFAELPRRIIKRHAKGDVEAPLGEFVVKHLNRIREALMEGELMRRGYLHKSATDKGTSGRPSDVSPANAELIRLYSIELWLSRWQSIRHRVAA